MISMMPGLVAGTLVVANSATPPEPANALVILAVFAAIALIIAVVTILLSRIGRR